MEFYSLLLFTSVFLTYWFTTAKGEVKPCDFPQFKYGRLYNEEIRRPYFPVSIGKEFSYYCDNGFSTPSGSYWDYLHCTAQGWEPSIPCLRQCIFHYVENGESSYWQRKYMQGQSAKVYCYNGYSLPNGQDIITCTENGWSPPAKCIRMACKPPYIPNGIYSPQRINYTIQDEITYECKDGFYPATQGTVAKCTSTGWIPTPRCSLKPCDFPQFKYGRLYNEESRRPYFPVSIGKEFSYYCDNGFSTPSGSYWDYLHCTAQGWEPSIPCLRQCIFHYVENGESSYWQRKYMQGQSVKVHCYNGYSLPNGQDIITCTENGWSPPAKCIIQSCDVPVFENSMTKNDSTWFKLNDKLEYECHVGYINKYNHTKGSVTCKHDGWSDKPSCYDSTKICGPPPPIENGDITSFPLSIYTPPSSVEYQCQSLYKLQGNKTIICINGEWSEPPKCLHPCIISTEIMEKRNITFRWKERQKQYYQSGEMQEFKCKNGHHLATTQPLNTTCINGYINYPTCTK